MSDIQAQIGMNDYFSSVLNNMVSSMNVAMFAMCDLRESVSAGIDTGNIENAGNEIRRTAVAMMAMNEVIDSQPAPAVPMLQIDSSPQPPPAEVPVKWQTDAMDTFTGAGTERFRQEVQSANSMLEQLCGTQDIIAKQAYRTNLFPPEAFQDMNELAVRIDTVRERILQIENNPVNIGTDKANAELEHLRGQLSQMVQTQGELKGAMQNMDVSAANDAYLRLSQTVSGTEQYIRDNVDEQGRFNEEIQEGTQHSNALTNMIKKMAGEYINMENAGKVLDISDELTQTTTRLNMMNDGLQSTPELVNMIYASARNTHAPFLETANAIADMENRAGEAFDTNAELIAFMEQANKQFAIGGAGEAEQAAALEQLSQAMASGTFGSDELNSILAAAPGIAGTIEQSMGWAEGSLLSYAAEGAVTAEVVKNSFLGMADETNAAFEQVPITFAQAMTDLKSDALKAFGPLLQRLNDTVNSETFRNFTESAVGAMGILAGVMTGVFDMMAAAGGFIADNWSIIEPLILGVAAALLVYNATMGITWLKTLQDTAAKIASTVASGAHAAGVFLMTVAQQGLNAALAACPLSWIIIMIIALIAIIYAAVAAFNKFTGESVSATGLIAGAFAVLGALILNTFVIPIINRFAMFANFIGNVFHNPVAAIKVLFYDMCLTVIGYIQNLAHGIEALLNKIPGVTVDITSGLDSFYDGLAAAQQAVKDESGWIEYVGKLDYIDYTGAADAGYEFGAGIEDKVSNFNLTDFFGGEDMPNPEDYKSQLDEALEGSGMGENLGSIAGDTGAIKDSMDITQEDLKYLRDIAEQEAINRFTTAEIHVDMSGMRNTVNSGDDIDGFMKKLTDSVYEAVDNMTEGVHA